MALQTLLNDYLLMEIQPKKLIHRLSVLRSLVIQNLNLKLQVDLQPLCLKGRCLLLNLILLHSLIHL